MILHIPPHVSSLEEHSAIADVTGLLKSKGQLTLMVKVLVGNGGEGYARVRVHYNHGVQGRRRHLQDGGGAGDFGGLLQLAEVHWHRGVH